MDSIDCLIPTYQELSAEQITAINNNSFVVEYKKKDTIFRQNMPISNIVFVKSGLVKVFKESGKNKNHIIKISPSNNFLGLLSSFCKNQYDYSATALLDCDIVFTEINVFKNVIKENGNYALQIMKQLGENGLFILDKLMDLSYKQVPGRIAGIILFLSKEIFASEEFEFPLTRLELAHLISSTQETVSRTLMEFKNDRIIEIDERKIRINSMDLISTLSRIG